MVINNHLRHYKIAGSFQGVSRTIKSQSKFSIQLIHGVFPPVLMQNLVLTVCFIAQLHEMLIDGFDNKAKFI